MAIEKLEEFAKDGQKNTEGLTQTDGFPVVIKPARQWFNWLFNTLTLKINEIIDEKIYYEDIIDNLTTDDAARPVSAKQAKVLQENKLGKTENAASASKLELARNIALSGDITGNADFDGSGNISILASMGAKLLNTTGYKIIGDIVLQWGAISAQNNSTVVATLPIAVGSILQAVCTYDFPNAVEYPLIAVGSFTQTSLTIGVKAANSNYYYIRWIAICKKA